MGLLIEVYLRVGLGTKVQFGYRPQVMQKSVGQWSSGQEGQIPGRQHEKVRSSSGASGVPAGLRTCSVTLAKSLCLGFLVVE